MPPAAMTWDDLDALPRPSPDATLSYGAAPSQRCDLWLPAGVGPFPVVVMVHGGCWQSDIADRRLMHRIAGDLRADGIFVWNVDYRGVDRHGGGYPGTFRDLATAADHLRTISEEYPITIDHIVAVGHSAGGHLALWLAARRLLAPTSPLWDSHPLPIDHVISLGGLPDLEAVAASPDNGCGTEVIARLVGADRSDPFADTSVPRLLPLGVGQDLVHGDADRIVPHHLATGYYDRAVAAGDDVTLHVVPDTGHVELIAPGTPAWTLAKTLIRKALR